MKIGIISDTHDHLGNIAKAVDIFRSQKVDHVIHAGDYVFPGAVRVFKGLKLKGIFGNNDGDRYRLIQAFKEIEGEIMGDYFEFEEDGATIAVYHGTEIPLKNALIDCGNYDIVIYGHSHVLEYKMYNKTLALNPGTANGFGEKATIMILDTLDRNVEVIELN